MRNNKRPADRLFDPETAALTVRIAAQLVIGIVAIAGLSSCVQGWLS